MKISFNHNYYLKHDGDRTILATNPYACDANVKNGWLSKIHPFYAMMFSLLFRPTEKDCAIATIANFFSITEVEAAGLISSFLTEEGIVEAKYHGTTSIFPPHILISDMSRIVNLEGFYEPSQFVFSKIDLTGFRMKVAPQGIVLIINNHCAANCIYCYADKKHACHSSLSLKTIERLLINAQKLGIREVQVIGGEFFLYPEWEKLLKMFEKYRFYQPLISTKISLTQNQIDTFKTFNIRLQISFDAYDRELLKKTLGVSDNYFRRIKATIECVDKASINYQITIVLTKDTANIVNIDGLYSFLKQLNNIQRWEIRFAFRSLYSASNFDDIKVPEDFAYELAKWYDEIINESPNHR